MTAATTKPRRYTPPPKGGTRFWDAELGRWRYKPRGRGKTVDYHSAEGDDARRRDGRSDVPFSARHALRRAGVTVDDTVGRGARATRDAGGGLLGDAFSSAGGPGIGALLVYGAGSLLGLILLDTALGGRGPAAVDKLLGGFGAGIRKLVDPTDPIIAQGAPSSPTSSSPPTPSGGSGSAAGGFLPKGASYTQGQTDHGRDFTTDPGGAVVAPGAGHVIAVPSDPNGFGPAYPVVHFTTGPYAGKTLYIGHTIAAVKPGQSFKAGDVLSRTSKTSGIGSATTPGWVEIGYGLPGSGSYGRGGPPF